MATGQIEQFLRVEEEANRLLDALERLREETQSYRASRELLEAAAQAVEGLASSIADASRQIISLRETLQSISTSDLLRAQEAIADQVNSLRTDLDQVHRSITEALDQSVSSTSERTAQQIDSLREMLEITAQAQQTELLRTRDIITSGTSELQTEISTHRSLTETIGQATTNVLKQLVTQTGAIQRKIELAEQEQREALQHLQQSFAQLTNLESVMATQHQLDQLGETFRHELEAGKQDLTNQLANIKAGVVTVRNLALFLLALLVITVGLFSLLAILMARS
jgi:archaellum component FlaC